MKYKWPAIIAKFSRRSIRNLIYSNKKHLNNTAISIYGFQGKGKLYIDENLTAAKKKLFIDAKEIRNRKGYKFIWTHNGLIYLRKDNNSAKVEVNTVDDLKNIV